ncbi:MAG: amidohydrolase family protein, partial [Bacteroidia bacterium]|nr:amidohydrolase family protein [Bacteroidia bacterium]
MKNHFFSICCLLFFSAGKIFSQITFPTNGAPNKNHNVYVFQNCSLHVDYQTVIAKATLIVKDGIIIEAAEKVTTPIVAGAVVVDLKGKHVYPSFIDMHSDYGMPDVKTPPKNGFGPQMESSQKGSYAWNMAVKPETDAYKLFVHDQKTADEMRRLGFGAVLTSQKDGVVRGTSTFVSLANAKENECVIKDKAAVGFSFRKGNSPQDFPESQTGAIALLRQTYLDAQWYSLLTTKTEYNIALETFNQQKELPQIFETTDKLNVLRADKIGDEFKVNYIMKGSGNEYQRITDMKETNCRFILPLNFPEAFDVEDAFDAEQVSLTDLKHWEMAPVNPGAFEKYFINFSLTLNGLKDKKSFYKNLRKAIEYGLSEKTALKALTYNPAEFLGVQNKVGSLKAGMLANFFISNKNVFEEGSVIYENWVNGMQNKFSDMNTPDISGKYTLSNVLTPSGNFTIKQNDDKFSGTVILKDTTKTSVTISFKSNAITIYYYSDSANIVRLSGNYDQATKTFSGKGQKGNGDWFDWKLLYMSEIKKDSAKTAEKKPVKIGDVIYPFVAYGKKWDDDNIVQRFKNRLGAILIKDATVWTNEA